MDKCILLVRVSTEGQDLTQQTEKVKEEAIKDGYKEKNIIVLEDKESAVKLSEEERNGLNKLKWHIEHDTIDCVYVYEISRLSRRPSVLYSIRDFLIRHGVQLIILNPFMKMLKQDGTLDEAANIYFGIFSSMAENEGFIRKARMRRGVEKKKAQGLHYGGPVAIGYSLDKDDRYIIDKEGAAWVRRIFEEYSKGISVRKLARQLQAEGWRTSTSFLTICQSILDILHREYYCGDKAHPQIISRELFDKCQALCENKTTYKKPDAAEALLKGIMFDAESGYLMSGNMTSKQYYSRRYGHATIKMEIADMIFGGIALEWYNKRYNVMKDELTVKIEKDIEKQDRIISTMTSKLTDIYDKIERIEERYIEGKITKQKADELEKKTFEDIQYKKKTLEEAQNEKIRLQESMKNNDGREATHREKCLDMIKRIDIKRISRFICEAVIENRWTGEKRWITIDTRNKKILKTKYLMRATLGYKK